MFFSGLDLLQYNDVTFEMLASAFPESLSSYMEFAQRLKIEGKKRIAPPEMLIYSKTLAKMFLLSVTQLCTSLTAT